jgi:hypothetical protein
MSKVVKPSYIKENKLKTQEDFYQFMECISMGLVKDLTIQQVVIDMKLLGMFGDEEDLEMAVKSVAKKAVFYTQLAKALKEG